VWALPKGKLDPALLCHGSESTAAELPDGARDQVAAIYGKSRRSGCFTFNAIGTSSPHRVKRRTCVLDWWIHYRDVTQGSQQAASGRWQSRTGPPAGTRYVSHVTGRRRRFLRQMMATLVLPGRVGPLPGSRKLAAIDEARPAAPSFATPCSFGYSAKWTSLDNAGGRELPKSCRRSFGASALAPLDASRLQINYRQVDRRIVPGSQ